MTGAGISTSAGIPDFRGPNGIWTREQKERKAKKRRKKIGTSDEKGIKDADCTEKTSTTTCSSNDDSNKKLPLHDQSNGRKRKQIEEDRPQKFKSFETALPTYTHRALTHMILHPPPQSNNSSKSLDSQRTYFQHIVTQNVDGLHRKTNLPRNKMSILHGCIFTEMCDTCNTEHVRKHEIQSIGLKHTGRKCTLGGDPIGSCPGMLKDTLLDWEDALPDIDWWKAQEECAKADLVLCLGTSLRIEPAASLCTFPIKPPEEVVEWMKEKETLNVVGKKKRSGKESKIGYAIVNLQQTPYDEGAALVVRGKVDDVMEGIMQKLGYGNNWNVEKETNYVDEKDHGGRNDK